MRNSCVTKEQREADGYYEEFVNKFKPKKTTDDCYTPDVIYDAVRDWAVREYSLSGARIIRPFWPGGDYQSEDYSGDCVVIDNPPFSILSSHGVELRIRSDDVQFCRALDAQKAQKKAIFGCGFLLSEKAAAEKAAAKKWELSAREREIVKKLSEGDEARWL